MKETIQSIPLTFYSKPFYQHLVHQGTGIGMGFVLLITLICSGSLALRSFHNGIESGHRIENVFEILPATTFKDGKLSIDQPSPWSTDLARPEDENRPDAEAPEPVDPTRLVIDTGYKADDLGALKKKMDKENIMAFVTAERVFTRTDSGLGLKSDEFADASDRTFTHENWASVGKTIGRWFFPGLLLLATTGIFLMAFLYTLIIATVLRILASILHTEPGFSVAMRVAAAAGIPVGIATALFPNMPLWLQGVVWLGFGLFGLLAARAPKQQIL